MVELAMRQADGNQTHAARLLDISRDALRYKLKKFGLIHGDEDGEVAGQGNAAEEHRSR
jgi:DNA-binding NtrC family response regulator